MSRCIEILFFNLAWLVISCNITNPEEMETYKNKILFTSNRSGKDQLYVMNPDGGNQRQITFGSYWNNSGRWSPDGAKIVCNTEEESSTAGFQMALMNSDGSNRELLGFGIEMAWHPDGNMIAFIKLYDPELGGRSRYLYVMDIIKRGVQQVTFDSLELIFSPTWSKDGNEIYFSSNRFNYSNNFDIYAVDIYSKHIRRVTFESSSCYSPSISHSGDQVVFMLRENNSSTGAIYLSDINFKKFMLIVNSTQDMIYNWPRWSADENTIIFTAACEGGVSIYKAAIETGEYVKFIANASQADWSDQ